MDFDRTVQAFAEVLEEAGLQHALSVLEHDVVPIARRLGCSLLAAAREYADDGEERDTSWYQMWEALVVAPPDDLEKIPGLRDSYFGPPVFDADLSPENPHNRETAEKLGVTFDPDKRVYVDGEGCPTHDRFGQKL